MKRVIFIYTILGNPLSPVVMQSNGRTPLTQVNHHRNLIVKSGHVDHRTAQQANCRGQERSDLGHHIPEKTRGAPTL